MDRTIAEIVAIHKLPFNYVGDTVFRRVMNAALPRYKLRGCLFTYYNFLYIWDVLYYRVTKKIKDLLGKFKKKKKSLLQPTYDQHLNSVVSLLSSQSQEISAKYQ